MLKKALRGRCNKYSDNKGLRKKRVNPDSSPPEEPRKDLRINSLNIVDPNLITHRDRT